MTSKHGVRLDLKAFAAYRRDPTVKSALNDATRQMAARCNANRHDPDAEYDAVEATDTPEGSIALVRTGNIAARADNARHNTILKSMT